MKKLTAGKAKQILEDGTVKGNPITDKQRRFFGAVSNDKSDMIHKKLKKMIFGGGK